MSMARGEAGNYTDHLPEDIEAYVPLYRGNEYNHAADWHECLARFPGIEVEDLDGYHLSGASDEAQAATIARVIAIQERLTETT
jgi:hypothetical protein